MFSASLHLSLSCSTNPQLWSKSLSLYPSCQCGCQRFCNLCMPTIEERDKQNTSNTLLIVGVWNYNVLCITAPMSTNPYLCSNSLSLYPSCQYGCQQFCNLCMPMIEKRDKQNTSNTLFRVGVWKYNVVTAPISVLLPIPIFSLTHCLSTHPANVGVNGFAICVCP